MRRFGRPEPTRLINLRPEDDPWRVAPLVRSVVRAPEEPPAARVKWRIRSTLRRKAEWRRRFLRVALVGGVIFLTGGVFGAMVGPMWGSRLLRKEATQGLRPAAPSVHVGHRRARSAGAGTVEPNPTALGPAPEFSSALTEAPVSTVSTVASAVTSSVPPIPVERKVVPTSAQAERVTATIPAAPEVKLALLHPTASPPRIQRVPAPPAPPLAGPAPTSPRPASSLEPPPTEDKLASGSPQASAAVPSVRPSLPRSSAEPTASPTVQITSLPNLPPAAAPSAAPVSEQGLLAAALRSLRSERRPDSALVALNDYLARFPNGVLYPEATRLRTEALLMLGHKHAALDELDRQSFDGTTGGEEGRLLRGELRAAAGRWRAAFEDFDAVVRVRLGREGASLSGEARLNERVERALWGRASARSHFGDDAGARTDLREYLRRFPQGRFGNQATHLLGELR